jgi:hypothetical protein
VKYKEGGGREVGTCLPLSNIFTIWGAQKGRHIPTMFLIFFLKEGNIKGRFVMISNLIGKKIQIVIFECNEDTINLALRD